MTEASHPSTIRPGARRIAIVGPCGSGKSMLAERLKQHGYQASHIAQEHSYVPDMWQKLGNPDVLVYLEASFRTCARRKGLSWSRPEHAEQIRRLEHARSHCDLLVDTDRLSPEQVFHRVIEWLEGGLGHRPEV